MAARLSSSPKTDCGTRSRRPARRPADWAGGGVDHVVEVGGKDTFQQSIEAARVGGTILVIGVLSGFAQQIAIPSLFGKNLHVIGLSVGSRRMFENMVSAIGHNHIKPVVDRTFGFTEVPDALRLMQQAGQDQNRPERPRVSPETERAERYRRKSPQKRPILTRPGNLRFGGTGWWARQGSNL